MWESRAESLANAVVHPQSRWWPAISSTARHLLVPRWFEYSSQARWWQLQDGPSNQQGWLNAAYSPGKTMVTRIGPIHADQATPESGYHGWPTSSATLPNLVITMYRHAQVYPGADVLDVGTGPGRIAIALCRADLAARVLAVDLAEAMLDLARRNVADAGLTGRIECVQGDAKALNWRRRKE